MDRGGKKVPSGPILRIRIMMAWLISCLETKESYSDQCNNQGTHALALISLLVRCLAVARHLPQAELGLHAVAADQGN